MRASGAVVLAAVLLALLECGGATEPKQDPIPGVLAVRFVTPNADDAAILLTVSGPASPTSVTPRLGLRLFQSGGLGTTTHLILMGALTTGPILTLDVPDVSAASSYHATIQGVASTTYLLRSVPAYALTVTQ